MICPRSRLTRQACTDASIKVGALPRFLLLYAAMYAAFGLASPFTPALLQDRGLGVTSVGAFLALGTAIRALSAPMAGRVADRLSALRPTLSACAAAAALASLFLLFPRQPALILGILFLYSVALAPVVPLSDALALGAAKPDPSLRQAGFRYGWVRGTGSGAFIVGALAGGQAIALFGFSTILIVSAALLGLAAIAAWFVPELRQDQPSATKHVRFRDAFLLFRIPAFRRVIIVAALILGGHALHDNFAVIRWRDEGIDPRTISILWSESVAAEVIVFFFIGEPLLRRIRTCRRCCSVGRRSDAALDHHGRDCRRSGDGLDRAAAWTDLRAITSHLHAGADANGATRIRRDRAGGLRHDRRRHSDERAHAHLRRALLAVRRARLLGDGRAGLGGAAADARSPHPGRAELSHRNRRFRLHFTGTLVR